ncbi:MAG: hypothetical protein NTZ68_03140 [Candidatus Dependentiae bacterium]|nr:hypothetical protein [Candidatus Dependentiae bacterium]
MKKTQKFLICLCIAHASIVFASLSSDDQLGWVKPRPLDPEILLEYIKEKDDYERAKRLDLAKELEAIRQYQEIVFKQQQEFIEMFAKRASKNAQK